MQVAQPGLRRKASFLLHRIKELRNDSAHQEGLALVGRSSSIAS